MRQSGPKKHSDNYLGNKGDLYISTLGRHLNPVKNERMNDAFCITPWIGLNTAPSGRLRVCCFGKDGHNSIIDAQGKKVSMKSTQQIEEIQNLPFLKNIRRQMLSGERPEVCSFCHKQEISGAVSLRQKRNDRFASHIPDILKQTKSDGTTTEMRLRHLDLRLSNLCNLGCRMCYPTESRYLLREWEELFPEKLTEFDRKNIARAGWENSPAAWGLIQSQLDHAEVIHLSGGEPLLVKEHVQLLKILVESGRASQVILKYNTNATVVNNQALGYWPAFKQVHLNLSIDGVGPVNHYIRYPAKWEQIERNLETFGGFAKNNEHFSMSVLTTVQAYNIFGLVELFHYLARRQIAGLDSYPHLNILNQPSHLSISVLPQELRLKAQERLSIYLQTGTHRIPDYFRKQVEVLILRLHQAEEVVHRREFIRFTQLLDRHRNQSLAEIMPELQNVLEIPG